MHEPCDRSWPLSVRRTQACIIAFIVILLFTYIPLNYSLPVLFFCFQGLKTARDIDALVYSETSAKTSESSVNDVVEVAALSSVGTRNQSNNDLKRSKSFIKKKRFSGMGEAKSTLRKEATKSCAIMWT